MNTFSIRFFMTAVVATALASTAFAAPHEGFPEPEYVEGVDGVKLAVYHKGEGVPVIFSHGFPELAYSWRYQLDALAEAGFHAIVPDQRGYGLSDRPEAIEAYNIEKLTGDFLKILDHFGYEKAVWVGHDWGGAVAWNGAQLHPERALGVVGVNTAYFPRQNVSPLQMIRAMNGEDNYMVWFQEPGVAEGVFEQDVEKIFRLFMRQDGMTAEEFAKLPPDDPNRNFEMKNMLQVSLDDVPGNPLLSEEDLMFYVDTFTRTGFTGGMNWYRNIDRNWELTEGVAPEIVVPALYVGAEDDNVLPPSTMQLGARFVSDLEQHVIEDCGHWTQQEEPEALNAILIEWLNRRFKEDATSD